MSQPHLQLVKSYNAANYPYKIRIDMNVDPKKVQLDSMCGKAPFYKAYKETSYFENRKSQILAVLKRGGIEDFTLVRIGNCLELGLTHEDDRPIVIAGLKPNANYSNDFVMGNTGWSNGKLRRAVREVRDIFNRTVIRDKVEFSMDKQRKTIRVAARNGDDFVSFWGVARLIEKANNMTFQSYIA